MPIKVLFFGSTAEITGKREMFVEISDSVNSRKVFDQLLTHYPSLASHTLLFSVNEQYATGKEILKEGDELAIFTAVSGGVNVGTQAASLRVMRFVVFHNES